MKMRSRQKLNKPKETMQEIAVAASKSQVVRTYKMYIISVQCNRNFTALGTVAIVDYVAGAVIHVHPHVH